MPYITSAKAAKMLGISKRTLFRLEEERRIKSVRKGVLKTRMYDQDYIKQAAEILELDRKEKEHLAKLPAIRAKVRKHLFATDVEEVRKGGNLKFMNLEKATEAFDEEEEWLKKHKEMLDKLFSYPRELLRELLLPREK